MSYSSVVLADSPTVVFALDESSGNLTDLVASKSATASGTPTYGATGPVAAHTAVVFDAAADYFTVSDHADLDLGNGPWTLEVWVGQDTSAGSDPAWLSKTEGAASYSGYGIGLDSSNRPSLFAKNYGVANGTNAIPIDSSWHHVVWTRASGASVAGDTKLYVDATNQALTTESYAHSLIDNDVALTLGRETVGYPAEARLAYLAIYKSVLTPTQISAHFAAAHPAGTASATATAQSATVDTGSAGGYSSVVLADSPTIYLRLGEASGTAADNLGSGGATYDGTYVDAPTLGATGAFTGDGDTAITLTAASTEYVTVPSGAGITAFAAGAACSYEIWMKRGSDEHSWLMSKGYNAPSISREAVTGTIKLLAQGYGTACISSVGITDTNWHHIVGTRTTSNVWALYIDGVDVTVYVGNRGISTNTDLLNIGRLYSGSGYFDGSLDECAVYDYALSLAQVEAHYAARLGTVSADAGVATATGAATQAQVAGGATNVNAVTATATGVAYLPSASRGVARYIAPTTGGPDGSPAGNNTSGTGSITAPWATIAKWMSMQPQAGETLYIRGGTYLNQPMAACGYNGVLGLLGTASAPITIRNYPGEVPIFSGGSGSLIGIAGAVSPSAYVVIDGIQITNRLLGAAGAIYVGAWDLGDGTGYNVEHVTIRNIMFTMAANDLVNRSHGVYFSKWCRYVTLEDSVLLGTGSGISTDGGDGLTLGALWGDYYTVQRCVFKGFNSSGMSVWSDAALALPFNERFETLISHCSFINNTPAALRIESHGPTTVVDCASTGIYVAPTTSTGAPWILHTGNAITDVTQTNNYFSQSFTTDYYLTAGSTGRGGASDGTDAGALDSTPGASPVGGTASATGTARDATVSSSGGAPAGTASATATAQDATATCLTNVYAVAATATATPGGVPMASGLGVAATATAAARVAGVAAVGGSEVAALAENASAVAYAQGPGIAVAVSAMPATATGSALGANAPAPPRWPTACEYVIELFWSTTGFGPGEKIAEIWDARNLGWSRYDRLPGRGFFTLYQTSPHLASIIPIITHVRVTRLTATADVEVFNGIVSDYNSTGDDAVYDIFDYVSLLSLSRSGYRTMYPTKLIGTEIVSPEWLLAKNATNSALGFVATGTIQDPLGSDDATTIKTNAQFGLMDQMRLALFYDLSEMGRANTIHHVTYEVTRTAPFTFNFWKNKGSLVDVPLVLNGTVSEYQYAPGWAGLRNDLATLGTTLAGGATEVVKADSASEAVFGLRQDVFAIKTLAGTGASTVESDQQQAVAARMLRIATDGTPALWITLVPGAIEPFTGWDICDTMPVEIVNGVDAITGNWRVLGARAIIDEPGERLQLLMAKVLT